MPLNPLYVSKSNKKTKKYLDISEKVDLCKGNVIKITGFNMRKSEDILKVVFAGALDGTFAGSEKVEKISFSTTGGVAENVQD